MGLARSLFYCLYLLRQISCTVQVKKGFLFPHIQNILAILPVETQIFYPPSHNFEAILQMSDVVLGSLTNCHRFFFGKLDLLKQAPTHRNLGHDSTAMILASDVDIQGNFGWRIQGNLIQRDQ